MSTQNLPTATHSTSMSTRDRPTRYKPNVTVACIIHAINADKYLLVEEWIDAKQCFNQPAGHLEAGESLLHACEREVFEETGLRLTPKGLVGIYQFSPALVPHIQPSEQQASQVSNNLSNAVEFDFNTGSTPALETSLKTNVELETDVALETYLRNGENPNLDHHLKADLTAPLAFVRFTFFATLTDMPTPKPQDDAIHAAHWLTFEQIVARQSQLRSPLVLDCIQDYRQGHTYPLALLNSDRLAIAQARKP